MAWKDRRRALLRVAQARSLRHQMLMLMAAVTAAAIGALFVLSHARVEVSARQTTESWARALAGNAAANALPLLHERSDRADDAALSVAEFDQRFALLCSSAGDYEPVGALVDGKGGVDSAHTLMLALPERRVLARVVRSASEGHGESILFFRDVTRETEVDPMKSEFLTTAAHELRTPMVSVFGFTELLLRRPVPEARRKDMLETIHRQASLLINMVNELLDLARIEARQGKDLKREACRIDRLITQAVGPLIGNSARHQIVLDIPHGDGVLWVDPGKTHRALTNVLSNAIKYSPAGGRIGVCTQAGQLRGEPAVGLTVSDAGIGMSAEQLARVFERFYRADPSGNIPGTGLGMSLVKEIVELQGGRVDIGSQPGAGTTVTPWLPVSGLPDALALAQEGPSLLGHDADAAPGKA